MWQRYRWLNKIYVVTTHRCQDFFFCALFFLDKELLICVFFSSSRLQKSSPQVNFLGFFFSLFIEWHFFRWWCWLWYEHLNQKAKQQTRHKIVLSGSPLAKRKKIFSCLFCFVLFYFFFNKWSPLFFESRIKLICFQSHTYILSK